MAVISRSSTAELAVIIVSYNTIDVLRECIEAVYAQCNRLRTEIIVVDNASTDGSVDMLAKDFPLVKCIANTQNLGFGVANNIGVAAATAPYIMLLNSDAIMLSDTGDYLVGFMSQHAEVACVAPRVVLPNGKPQPKVFGYAPNAWRVFTQSVGLNRLYPQCDFFGGIDSEYRKGEITDVGWLSGVCLVMRRQDYLKVGGFDAQFFMYCEDIDLCVRLKKHVGKLVLVDVPEVKHYGGASSKTLAAKVRNAVWQQRHLLIIIKASSGQNSWLASTLFITLGLVIRLGVGLALSPLRGFKHNETLQMARCRLADIVGIYQLKKPQ